MAAIASTDEFLELIRKSGVTEEKRFDAWLKKAKANGPLPAKPTELAGLLVRDGILTTFQAEQLLLGRWRRFTIGKYKVLEKLGSGGMGSVYLCEHKLMRRRVAVKVLPTAKAQEESALERFYREARAVAALDHPNIVHAYDIDKDESLHFLVMEYVDGASLQEIVKKTGPMDITRACHYIRQAALGLDHAHLSGLIHRDIKPGNILVDRTGVVKILDMGLARFFNDEDDVLTKKFDENVLGTADYLAPEQAIDSHEVDVRADIYSLGATFYFMLTGRTPFGEGTVAQKLLWHQNRQPKPVTEFRPDVPARLSTIIATMMAKDKADRYQTPAEVADVLASYTEREIGPPPEVEMPRLSPAATGQVSAPESAETAIVKNEAPVVPKALQGMSSKTQPSMPVPPKAPGPKSPAPKAGSPAKPAAPTPPPKPVSRPASSSATVPVTKSSLTPRPNAAPTPLPKTPLPAPAPQPAFSAVAEPEPVAVEEEAPWESLSTADTEDPSAKADTAPAGKSARQLKQGAVKNPRRAWLVLGSIVGGVVVLTTAVLIYRSLTGDRTKVLVRPPLEVTKNAGSANSYRSILQALRAAKPGDVIQLMDSEHFENLLIEPRMKDITPDVTIQAAPGREVVWKPFRKDDMTPILWLQEARNFKIKGKGLTFDGTLDAKRRVQNLIVINFESPGLAIEDAAFKGFGRSAINIVNVWGSKEKPVRLVNLTAISAAPEQPVAALLFDANPDVRPPYNDFIEVVESHFQGQKEGIKTKDNTVVGSNVHWPK
jgi:serine/threonine protein kinase